MIFPVSILIGYGIGYLLDRWLYELQTFDISAQDLDFVGSIAFIDDDLEDDV